MSDAPERIRAILAALDIPEELIRARSLPVCAEAEELVLAEIGTWTGSPDPDCICVPGFRGPGAAAPGSGLISLLGGTVCTGR